MDYIRLLDWADFRQLTFSRQISYVNKLRREKMMDRDIAQSMGTTPANFCRWKRINGFPMASRHKVEKRLPVPQKSTLCWTCNKACGGCSWSRSLKPVKGWTAKINPPKSGPETLSHIPDYFVIDCPEYGRG